MLLADPLDDDLPIGQNMSAEKALSLLVAAVCLARSGVQLVAIPPDTLSVVWLVL